MKKQLLEVHTLEQDLTEAYKGKKGKPFRSLRNNYKREIFKQLDANTKPASNIPELLDQYLKVTFSDFSGGVSDIHMMKSTVESLKDKLKSQFNKDINEKNVRRLLCKRLEQMPNEEVANFLPFSRQLYKAARNSAIDDMSKYGDVSNEFNSKLGTLMLNKAEKFKNRILTMLKTNMRIK